MNRRELLTRAAQLGAAATVAPQLTAATDAIGAGTRPPNILVLMTDQERHRDRLPDDLPVPTRCWFDAHGTNIDRFHSSSMACSPARGCLWTGMYAPQQGMYGTFIVGAQFNMDPSIPTIGDLFKELGYRTAFFGKWHLSYPGEIPSSPEQAFDTAQGNPLHSFGFDDSVISPPSDTGPYNDGYTNDPIWTAQALGWLRSHVNDTQPWFCVLSLLNPHDIQFFPRGFRADYQRPTTTPSPTRRSSTRTCATSRRARSASARSSRSSPARPPARPTRSPTCGRCSTRTTTSSSAPTRCSARWSRR